MGLTDELSKLMRQAHDHERLIDLLHRLTLEREIGEGSTLTAIAEDALIDYYERYKVQGRLLSKKEAEKTKSPTRLRPF